MVQTFIPLRAVMYGAEVWDTTKRSKTRCQYRRYSAAVEIRILPETAPSDVSTNRDTVIHPCTIDAAKPCWQHRCQNMEAGRWPAEALRFSLRKPVS
jgi:hypothetical protein